MNITENMHEVRFTNIYILSHIIYYIQPLTIIIALAIKTVDFFTMHYDDIKQRLNMIYFNFDFLFQTNNKFITSCLKR